MSGHKFAEFRADMRADRARLDKLETDPANNLNTPGQPIMMDESEDEDLSNDNWNSKNATIYESRVLDPCGRLPPEVNKAPPHANSGPPDRDSCELGKCRVDTRPGKGR